MVTFNIIAIILIFGGIAMTFPFVKRDEIRAMGWGLASLGWLIMLIISFIKGSILLAVFDFILLIGGLYFLITTVKEIRK
jgi:predicted tellurium resistance membrane protein TerC